MIAYYRSILRLPAGRNRKSVDPTGKVFRQVGGRIGKRKGNGEDFSEGHKIAACNEREQPKDQEMKMNGKIKYEFSATTWQYSSPGAWYFVSLPKGLSEEIRENFKWQEEGWGRLKATAKIGNSEWETAIWFDTKMNTYLLPLKSEIRKKENLEIGKNAEVIIWI